MIGTREGFLSRVHSDMVYKLVFRFKWSPLPGTVGPVAGIVSDLRAPHMVHCEVGDNIVHAVECLLTDLLGVLVNPLAGHLCLEAGPRGPHVPVVGAHVAWVARSPHAHGPVVAGRGRALSPEAEGVMEAGVHRGGGGWVG